MDQGASEAPGRRRVPWQHSQEPGGHEALGGTLCDGKEGVYHSTTCQIWPQAADLHGVDLWRGLVEGVHGLQRYVSLLLEEPCGRSVPSSLFKAVAFLEMASEVHPEKRITTTQAIHNYLMEVSKGSSWAPHQRVKAARIPLEVARAWEQGVLDVSLQKFKRVYCWHKLIKLWGALRSHDAEGVPPATLIFDEAVGLQGDIVRGKTTGVGRRVEVVQFFVSKDAWLISRDWLRVGLELFMGMNRDITMGNRDFLTCKPTDNLQGFRKSMMRYPDAMCFSRALLTELYSTRKNEEGNLYRTRSPLRIGASTASG